MKIYKFLFYYIIGFIAFTHYFYRKILKLLELWNKQIKFFKNASIYIYIKILNELKA